MDTFEWKLLHLRPGTFPALRIAQLTIIVLSYRICFPRYWVQIKFSYHYWIQPRFVLGKSFWFLRNEQFKIWPPLESKTKG